MMVARLVLLVLAVLFFLAVWKDDGRQSRPMLARMIVAVQLACAMWVMMR